MKRAGLNTGAERMRWWWKNEGSGRCLAAVAAGWDSDGSAGRAAAAVADGDDSYAAAAAAVERRPAAVAHWMITDSWGNYPALSVHDVDDAEVSSH